MSRHPFSWLAPNQRGTVFVVLLVGTLLVGGVLQWLDQPLQERGAGILDFELIGSLDLAQKILKDWGPQGRLYAAFSLGLDYLYLCLYSSTIALACVLVAARWGQPGTFVYRLGILLAWLQFAAALCDAVENYALLSLLLDAAHHLWPVVARWFALVKFGLIGLGAAYVLLGLIRRRWHKPRRTR